MNHYCSIGFLLLLSCCLIEALPRPTNNEEPTTVSIDSVTEVEDFDINKERSLMYQEDDDFEGNTKEIIEKIQAINDAIKRPHKRPQINWNTQPQTGGGYIMDKDVLEKLQQIIASAKIHSYPDKIKNQDDNLVQKDFDFRDSKQLQPNHNALPIMPIPYLTNMPVLVMPSQMIGQNVMGTSQLGLPLTRQGPESPTLPFLQWQSFFPILIRDPIQSIINGGGWNYFIEYGQSADICRKSNDKIRSKTNDDENINNNLVGEELNDSKILEQINNLVKSRQGRAINKRTVSHDTRDQQVGNTKKVKKIFSTKPFTTTTRKPLKQAYEEQEQQKDEGDLRFPFSDFGWFGNKKPVAPSPGFFINRLKVRKGGVAIAGPGGVATAGRGGTAIVGPGGLAYTQPGGLAVAGPAAKVVALSPDVDLSSIVSRLQEQNGSVPRSLQAIPEGKVVATGPIIYYHPNQE